MPCLGRPRTTSSRLRTGTCEGGPVWGHCPPTGPRGDDTSLEAPDGRNGVVPRYQEGFRQPAAGLRPSAAHRARSPFLACTRRRTIGSAHKSIRLTTPSATVKSNATLVSPRCASALQRRPGREGLAGHRSPRDRHAGRHSLVRAHPGGGGLQRQSRQLAAARRRRLGRSAALAVVAGLRDV